MSSKVVDKRVGKKVIKPRAKLPPKTKPPMNKKQPAQIIKKKGWRKKGKKEDDDGHDDEEVKKQQYQQQKKQDPFNKIKTITQWEQLSILKLHEEIQTQIKNKHRKADQEQICPICKCQLYQRILTLDDQQLEEIDDLMHKGQIKMDVVKFQKCQGHWIHKDCAEQLRQNYDFVQCPICLIIYGVKTGDQPDGTMRSAVDNSIKCNGFTCGTIVINYQFPSGVQQNGIGFSGTHRTAFLPNNTEGQEILKLLKLGFHRRLVFTIGTSVTTGMSNCVIWNGVHHKTNLHGGASHYGYPDPTYFTRVKEELAVKGVLIDQIGDDQYVKIEEQLVNVTAGKGVWKKPAAKKRKAKV